jgi:hypothetical protein
MGLCFADNIQCDDAGTAFFDCLDTSCAEECTYTPVVTRVGGTCEAPVDFAAVATTEGTSLVVSDTTEGAAFVHDGECGLDSGQEVVFMWTATTTGSYVLTHVSDLASDLPNGDPVLYVRATDCANAASELACNDDSDSVDTYDSEVTFAATAGTVYYFFADTLWLEEAGAFVLTLTPQ